MTIQWVNNPEGQQKKNWIDFVKSNDKTNFFQSHEFTDLYKINNINVTTLMGMVDNKIVSSLTLCILKEKGPHSYFTRRAISWGGPLIASEEFYYPTVKKAIELFKKEFIFWEIRPLIPMNPAESKALTKLGFNLNQHYTVFNDLTSSSIDQYHPGRRKNIRRAVRNEKLQFKVLDHEDEFEKAGKIIVALYRRLKLPCPNEAFFKSSFKFSSVYGFALYHEKEMVACRFLLHYNNSLYDWYAADNDAGKKLYANDLIVHKIFQWANGQGISHFDFGGAGKKNKDYGVRDYKLKFGGELIEIGRPVFINNKLMFKIGTFGFWISKFFRK